MYSLRLCPSGVEKGEYPDLLWNQHNTFHLNTQEYTSMPYRSIVMLMLGLDTSRDERCGTLDQRNILLSHRQLAAEADVRRVIDLASALDVFLGFRGAPGTFGDLVCNDDVERIGASA